MDVSLDTCDAYHNKIRKLCDDLVIEHYTTGALSDHLLLHTAGLKWKDKSYPTSSVHPGANRASRCIMGRGVIAPSETYKSNPIHHNFVQFKKQNSRYKVILSSIVLSQQFCEACFISLFWDLATNITEIAPPKRTGWIRPWVHQQNLFRCNRLDYGYPLFKTHKLTLESLLNFDVKDMPVHLLQSAENIGTLTHYCIFKFYSETY